MEPLPLTETFQPESPNELNRLLLEDLEFEQDNLPPLVTSEEALQKKEEEDDEAASLVNSFQEIIESSKKTQRQAIESIITHPPREQNIMIDSEHVIEMLVLLTEKMDKYFEIVINLIHSIDIRKIKRKRTIRNRCRHMNRHGQQCKGYWCKQSKNLCYAHYIKMQSNIGKIDVPQFLFKKKNPSSLETIFENGSNQKLSPEEEGGESERQHSYSSPPS